MAQRVGPLAAGANLEKPAETAPFAAPASHNRPYPTKVERRKALEGASDPSYPWRRTWNRAGAWQEPWFRWAALGVVLLLIVASLGVVYLFTANEKDPGEYLEVYLSDVPGDFEKIELRLSGVFVGAKSHPLELVTAEFDILEYQGTARSLLIAAGYVPRGTHTEVKVVFLGARGLVADGWVDIAVPSDLLTVRSLTPLGGDRPAAVLLDLDMDRSLKLTEQGFEFRPYVTSLYVQNLERAPPPGAQASDGKQGTLREGGFNHTRPVQDPPQENKAAPTGLKPSPRPSSSPAASSPNSGAGATFRPSSGADGSASAKPTWERGNASDSPGAASSDPTTNASDVPETTSESSVTLPVSTSTPNLAPTTAGTNCGPDGEDPTCGEPNPDEDVNEYIVQFLPGETGSSNSDEDPLPTLDSLTGTVLSPERQAFIENLVEWYGGDVIKTFKTVPAVVVKMLPSQAQALFDDEEVYHVELAGQNVTYNSMASSRQATMWNALQASGSPLGAINPSALPFGGAGVGIAMIDTGVDATHPDLPYDVLRHRSPAAVVYENYKMVSAVAVPNSDTESYHGHGTHVAGIMVGQPSATDASQHGLAPEAKLYAWGAGEGTTLYWITQAYDDLLYKMATQQYNPPIRVIQNSWSTGTDYDANSLLVTQVNQAIDRGAVVVFSAGNDGGSGATSKISAQCRIPREGVICVGGFHDQDTGSRDGLIYSSSSRGRINQPNTWPDLAAPATNIRSTKPVGGTLGGEFNPLNPYGVMSGTSVGAPFVSAAVALMFEANPDLVPAQVEFILEDTAYKFSDGGGYAASNDYRYDGSHYAKGHGLLDVQAAVQRAASES